MQPWFYPGKPNNKRLISMLLNIISTRKTLGSELFVSILVFFLSCLNTHSRIWRNGSYSIFCWINIWTVELMGWYYIGFSSCSWGEQLWPKAACKDTRLPQSSRSPPMLSSGTILYAILMRLMCRFLQGIGLIKVIQFDFCPSKIQYEITKHAYFVHSTASKWGIYIHSL